MMKRTTLALAAALVLGSASTALAQYASPGPTYVAPYAYGTYGAPNAYGPNGYDTGWTNPRALHQRRGAGDTNGW